MDGATRAAAQKLAALLATERRSTDESRVTMSAMTAAMPSAAASSEVFADTDAAIPRTRPASAARRGVKGCWTRMSNVASHNAVHSTSGRYSKEQRKKSGARTPTAMATATALRG